MEHPRGPTDLVGEDVPSQQELADLRILVERLLLGKRVRFSQDGSVFRRSNDDASSSSSGLGGLPMGGSETLTLDLNWLIRCEAMLSMESGCDIADTVFADWVAFMLPMLSA
jgi:hypothetical protein